MQQNLKIGIEQNLKLETQQNLNIKTQQILKIGNTTNPKNWRCNKT